jgi:hypothetical protein
LTKPIDWSKPIAKSNEPNPYFLNAQEANVIGQILNRAKDQLEAYKRQTGRTDLQGADWVQLSMDIINAHRDRRIKLLQWLMSDEASFLHDLAMIHKFTDRTCGRLPDGVRLTYAEKNPGVVQG